jgi:hypothetical protein
MQKPRKMGNREDIFPHERVPMVKSLDIMNSQEK